MTASESQGAQPKRTTNFKHTGLELTDPSKFDVRVHMASQKPAALQQHAYAKGSKIHLSPGQDNHLPHEAWHVVQQQQGRVKPTMQM